MRRIRDPNSLRAPSMSRRKPKPVICTSNVKYGAYGNITQFAKLQIHVISRRHHTLKNGNIIAEVHRSKDFKSSN